MLTRPLYEVRTQHVLIDFLRAAAAWLVCFTHLRDAFLPDFKDIHSPTVMMSATALLSGFAGQAVMIFFVLSGWLVGGSLLDKGISERSLYNYCLDRITRLWTVLIPALLTSALIVLVIRATFPTSDAAVADIGGLTFIANLVGLQTIFFHIYGGNYPLWSLANETWYYVFFPLLILLGTRSIFKKWRIVAAGILLLLAFFIPSRIWLYFTIWLAGTFFSRLRCDNRYLCVLTLCVMGGLGLVFRVHRLDGVFYSDATIGVLTGLAILFAGGPVFFSESKMLHFIVALSKKGAAFSFSLYVVHAPIIILLHELYFSHRFNRYLDQSQLSSWIIFSVLYASLIIIAYIFYLFFEKQTYIVRRALKSRLMVVFRRRIREL